MTGTGDNLKAQCLVSMVDEVEHPKRAPTAFFKLSEIREAAHCLKKHDAQFVIFGRFCSITEGIFFLDLLSHCLFKAHN